MVCHLPIGHLYPEYHEALMGLMKCCSAIERDKLILLTHTRSLFIGVRIFGFQC